MKDIKKKLKNMFNYIKKVVIENKYLVIFIFGNVLNSYLLRASTVKTYFNIEPLLGDLAFTLLIAGFSLFFKRKGKDIYFIIWTIISVIFCIGNALYYTYYNSFASVTFVAMLFSNYDTGGVNVLENIFNLWFLLFIWLPIFFVIHYINDKKNNRFDNRKTSNRKVKKFYIVFIIITLLFLSMLRSIDFGRFRSQWNREYLVTRFGLYIYQLNDIVKSIEPKITTLFGSDEAKKNFTDFVETRSDTQNYNNKYTNIFKGKNLILIHAESIQTLAMKQSFNGLSVTPNLNKLANEGLFFNNFYSQVSIGTSSDSEFTSLTSLLPVNTGSVFISYYDRKYLSIPNLLKENGYQTFSMHANNGSFWNRKIMHKNLGYDNFYDKSFYKLETEDQKIGFGLSDKEFFLQSVPVIKEAYDKGNFMATLIMLSNHTPFSDTDKYGEYNVDLKVDGISYPYMEGTKLGNYFKSAHYADEQIGLLINELDRQGVLDNTVIVIYGDHDARLSKVDYTRLYNYDYATNNIKDKNSESYVDIDYYWYELNRNVPFIIWTKDKTFKTTINKAMGMYDVMPTLGNMFGIYNKYALGNDIFNIDENVVLFPNGNWLTNKIYYNSNTQEYKILDNSTVISEDYINKYVDYSSKILNLSDNMIVYDLIKYDLGKEK